MDQIFKTTNSSDHIVSAESSVNSHGVSGQPQLLLRIGRTDEIKSAVRRPVSEVLLTQMKIAAR